MAVGVALVAATAVAVLAVTRSGPAGRAGPSPAGPATAVAGRRPSATTRPVDAIRLAVTPASGARGVALDAVVRVAASAGRIRAVTVRAPGTARLAGVLGPGGRTWTSTSPVLAPGARYRVDVDLADDAGGTARRTAAFTTLTPRHVLGARIMPLDGETVGVGLPIGIWFTYPVGDRAAVERRLHVTVSKPVSGAWHWFGSTEVHYRPRGFWPRGERVRLTADLAGVHAGRGTWGLTRYRVRFTVGDAHVSTVDVNTHHMTVTSNGKVLRVLPVSTGRDAYPTTNGVHFVIEKTQDKLMDSATVGIPRDSPDGYYEHVFWSVRISNSGEFVHAAPWSVGAQGRANVSHGCVNLSTADATWFFGLARRGDVVTVVGSPKKPTGSFGVADWNMSWSAWLAGSATRRA